MCLVHGSRNIAEHILPSIKNATNQRLPLSAPDQIKQVSSIEKCEKGVREATGVTLVVIPNGNMGVIIYEYWDFRFLYFLIYLLFDYIIRGEYFY